MGRTKQEKIKKKISKKRDSFRLRKADRINTSAFEGLSLEQVEERNKDNLVNKKPLDKTKSYLRIFVDNIFNFCNSLIMILCIILLVMGYWDYTISSAMIGINMAIGIYQEIKAKLTVQKLSFVNKSMCDVIRGGQTYSISTEEIVLDDVFVLNAGQPVPVDGEILDGVLELDESILTGESDGVRKTLGNKVLAGSAVLSGEAAIRAERVGKDCYIESIAEIAKKINKPQSKLFDSIDKIIKFFSVILFILGAILLGAYRLAGEGWNPTMLGVISSMLGMIPCGMFVVTSTALAQSVLKLTKTNALPQDIYSVEMLAMVDTLLLDKTGTITDGKLEVLEKKMFAESSVSIEDIIITMDDNNKDKKPTAQALNDYCKSGNILPCADALAFSSKRKYSAIKLENGLTYLLGAPDFISPNDKAVNDFCESMASEGKRTILLASFDGDIDDVEIEKTEPVCVFVLEEELKSDVKATLAWFNANDVDIKIISGDNPKTVSAIAQKAGVFNADKYVNCAELSDEELKIACIDAVVFGRVSPEQKVLIVKQLKQKKHVVGMIGDGVNDVQALKASDCSISFGNANEVARNISRIVLLDNNFSSMTKIVDEGRRVIGNIERVSSLYIMKNLVVMALTFVFAIITMCVGEGGYPFDTKQMLMVEFFVICIPSFTFALMPNAERVKGSFLRNVIKVSIPSALSILSAIAFIMILGYCGAIHGEWTYVISLAALAMTFGSFTCVFFISLPLNKIRLIISAIAMILSVLCVYIDETFLNGLFLNIKLPTTFVDVIYLVVSIAIAIVVNMVARKAFEKLDDKYGESFSNKIISTGDRFKEKIQRFKEN